MISIIAEQYPWSDKHRNEYRRRPHRTRPYSRATVTSRIALLWSTQCDLVVNSRRLQRMPSPWNRHCVRSTTPISSYTNTWEPPITYIFFKMETWKFKLGVDCPFQKVRVNRKRLLRDTTKPEKCRVSHATKPKRHISSFENEQGLVKPIEKCGACSFSIDYDYDIHTKVFIAYNFTKNNNWAGSLWKCGREGGKFKTIKKGFNLQVLN